MKKLQIKQESNIIITIITHQNIVEFQRLLTEFKEGKQIIRLRKGVSMVTVVHAGQPGIMSMPYAYIEHQATEEEYRIWKFSQQIAR